MSIMGRYFPTKKKKLVKIENEKNTRLFEVQSSTILQRISSNR